MILICLSNAGCLKNPENPEMSLEYPERTEFHEILSWNTLKYAFSDFHRSFESCLSVNRIELTMKYRRFVMQKLLCVSRFVDLEKMMKSLLKNLKNMAKIR